MIVKMKEDVARKASNTPFTANGSLRASCVMHSAEDGISLESVPTFYAIAMEIFVSRARECQSRYAANEQHSLSRDEKHG